MEQTDLGLNLTTKRTRKREFLSQMERVVPWGALVELVSPYAPEGKKGRPPFAVETMLRIHFMQQWFTLSDPAMEEALHDIALFREFAGLGWDSRLPDESTILRFRHLLEKHKLAEQILAVVNDLLRNKGLLLKAGTVVDATLISAPSSTKNQSGERDPEMHQTKKGNQWYFGMKAHIGVDAKSGLVHTAGVTTGKVHDAKVMDNLIRENDRAVHGDKGYASDVKKRAAEEAGVLWAVKEKAKPGRELTKRQRAQPPFRPRARQGRACFPRAEMPVRLSQGSLSRHRQERRAGVRTARACQSIYRPRPARWVRARAGR